MLIGGPVCPVRPLPAADRCGEGVPAIAGTSRCQGAGAGTATGPGQRRPERGQRLEVAEPGTPAKAGRRASGGTHGPTARPQAPDDKRGDRKRRPAANAKGRAVSGGLRGAEPPRGGRRPRNGLSEASAFTVNNASAAVAN